MLLLLLPLLSLSALPSILGLERCSDAPEEGIRIICEQIEKWDKNSRTVSPSLQPLHSVHAASLESSRTVSSFYDCLDIPCLCKSFGGQITNNWCRLPNGQFLGKALRKEYRQMTDQERSNYHAATWKMRNDGTYGELSRIHSNFTIAAGAHSGPAFLPWHREYIKRMEFALRRIDPTISLPYWDSTLDNNIPNPLDSILWGDELMGYPSMENTLLSGSFSHWRTDDNTRYIRRRLGEQAALMNEEHIKSFMAFTNINDVLASTAARTGCPRNASWSSLEFTHGNPHVYVGGDMLATTNSTNDPIFFLHHSFIDLLWENWRQSKQSSTEREFQYPDDDVACNSMSHFSNSIMQPFYPLSNADGLSNKYSDLNDYMERPSCSTANPDCKSRFLFCDVSHGQPRCASRIRRGGNCTGFTRGEFPCYEGQCIRNICTDNDFPTSTNPITTASTSASTTIRSTVTTTLPTTIRSTVTTTLPTTIRSTVTTTLPTTIRSTISTTLPTTTRSTVITTSPTTTRTPAPTISPSTTRSTAPSSLATTTSTTSRTVPVTWPTVRPSTIFTPPTTVSATTVFTTLKPISTVAPKVCLNENHCCQGWADYGECRNNPGYMNKNCMASCRVCTPMFNLLTECDNRAADCDFKITTIGCSTPWMYENCRQKCGMCNQTRMWQCTLMGTSPTSNSPTSTVRSTPLTTLPTTTTTTTTATTTRRTESTPLSTTLSNLTTQSSSTLRTTSSPVATSRVPPSSTSYSSTKIPRPTCWNYHYCCEAWAFKDFCIAKNTSAYMNHYCAPSCDTCRKGTLSPVVNNAECKDDHPTCAFWASKNECTASSEFMFENCKLSCGKCSLLSMSTRLKACGYKTQLRKTKGSLPENMFDINPWEMPALNSIRKTNKVKTEFTSV